MPRLSCVTDQIEKKPKKGISSAYPLCEKIDSDKCTKEIHECMQYKRVLMRLQKTELSYELIMNTQQFLSSSPQTKFLQVKRYLNVPQFFHELHSLHPRYEFKRALKVSTKSKKILSIDEGL